MKTGYTMQPSSRKDYWRKIHSRYQQASRSERRRILDECCANCSYHRKYAIRLLNGAVPGSRPRRARRRRGVHYGLGLLGDQLERLQLPGKALAVAVQRLSKATERAGRHPQTRSGTRVLRVQTSGNPVRILLRRTGRRAATPQALAGA